MFLFWSVTFDAELQYLKPHLPAQALVHHRFVMDLHDGIWIDEKTGKTAACRVMAVKAYSRTQAKFWYFDFTITSHADRCDLQLPVRRGTVKSVNHAMNLQDLFRQLFNQPLHARRRSKGKLLKMPKREGPLLVILNK